MQQTNFRFEAVIHDDASTDGTGDIIREFANKYPEIIKPYIETENKWSKHDGSLSKIMDALTTNTKYIAFCEGDDYWTDPLKLQMQVDILESNDNVKLCYTAFETVDDKGNYLRRKGYEANMKCSKSGDVLSELFLHNFIQTVSVCIRTDVFVSEIANKCPSKYDYTYFLTAACLGDVAYLPIKTCCYRKSSGSVTITQNATVNKGLWNAYKYFVSVFYNGETKELSSLKRQIIRSNILTRFILHNESISYLLKRDRMMVFLLPISLCKAFYFKVKNLYYYINE